MEVYLIFLIFGFVCAHEGKVPVIKEHPSNVIARRNDPATLNCAATGGAIIRWFKDGKEVITSPQDSRSHKVLLPSGSLFFLRVTSNKKETDSGTYYCVAQNKYGVTRSKNATLIITTLQQTMQSYPPWFAQRPSNLTVASRVDVEMTCIARGSPEPIIKWRRLDGKLPLGVTIEKQRLVLRQVTVKDSGTYVCEAKNEAGTSTSHATLSVLSTPMLRQKPHHLKLITGKSAKLQCDVEGVPQPLVLWRLPTLDRTAIVVPGQTLGYATASANGKILTLNSSTSNSNVAGLAGGIYYCWGVGEGGGVSGGPEVTIVGAAPPPVIGVGPGDMKVMVGGLVTFPCEVVSEGADFNITWWFSPVKQNSDQAERNSDHKQNPIKRNSDSVDQNPSLVNQNLHKKNSDPAKHNTDPGNQNPSLVSQNLVKQNSNPDIKIMESKVRIMEEKESVRIMESSVRIIENGARLTENDVQITEESAEGRISLLDNGALIIRNVREEDAGTYTCRATARSGDVQKSAKLKVGSAERWGEGRHMVEGRRVLPAPPSKPRLIGVNLTSVELSWLPNSQEREKIDQWYSLEFWRQGWNEWRAAESVIMGESCTVRGLAPGHTYIFQVRAVTSNGPSFPSPWSDPITTKLPRDPSLSPDEVKFARRKLQRTTITLNTVISLTSTSVQLEWGIVGSEEYTEGVLVYWVMQGTGVEVATVLGTATSTILRRLKADTRYIFFLVPYWKSVEGTPSNSMTLTTPEDVPLIAPSKIKIIQQQSSVKIQWSPLTHDEARGKISHYHLKLSHNHTHITHTIPKTSVELRMLQIGLIYTVQIAAVTQIGIGPWSEEVKFLRGKKDEEEGDSVLYAPPQAFWLVYLLIPALLLILLVTLVYMRVFRKKTVSEHSKKISDNSKTISKHSKMLPISENLSPHVFENSTIISENSKKYVISTNSKKSPLYANSKTISSISENSRKLAISENSLPTKSRFFKKTLFRKSSKNSVLSEHSPLSGHPLSEHSQLSGHPLSEHLPVSRHSNLYEDPSVNVYGDKTWDPSGENDASISSARLLPSTLDRTSEPFLNEYEEPRALRNSHEGPYATTALLTSPHWDPGDSVQINWARVLPPPPTCPPPACPTDLACSSEGGTYVLENSGEFRGQNYPLKDQWGDTLPLPPPPRDLDYVTRGAEVPP